MEIPFDLRSVGIVMTITLFSGIIGKDAEVAESSPRSIFMRKSFHYPDYNQLPNRRFMPEGPQFWNSQSIPTVDPHIDSLMRSTAYLINTMHRLEVKFDRVFDAAHFEENGAHDVMDKLRLIYKYIKGTSTNACQMDDSSSSVNEMPQSNLMRELVDAVKYSNENIRRVATNFDTVMESGKRSMQSLEKVAETVQDINERTIRIQQTSSGQFSVGSSHLYRDETASRVNVGSNNYEITERNKNFPTSDQLTQHLITQTINESTDRRATFNDNNSHSVASARPTHESSGGAIHNWSRNSQATSNNYGGRNGNTDQGHQFGTGTMTNYDTNGRDNHSEVGENQNVGHNRSNYEEKMKDFKESEIVDHNKTLVVSKPIVPEVNNWNSHETFAGESTQSQKIGHNNNDRIGIQQTQQSYVSKGNGAFIDNKPPVESSSRSTFESSSGESGSWNSHKSSNEEIKPGVAQANNHNWSRNSQANSNNYENKNGNTDRGHQSGTETLTNYDTNHSGKSFDSFTIPEYESNQNRNSFTKSTEEVRENQNVGHNRSHYEERMKDFKESEIDDHNKTLIVSKPIVPEVNNWNSHETFAGESTQSQKIGHNNNDRIGIQKTQQSYVSKGNGAFIDNKPPVESSSRSTFESSSGESGSWNSNKSSNHEIKPGVAQANNYESVVSEIFDENFVASNKTNNETSGIALQGSNYASNSDVQLKENENVSRTSYDSRGSAHTDLNVTSMKTNIESGKTEERSHVDTRNSSSGTKEMEFIEQKTSIVAPATTTTTTTTTTEKPQTTTTTTTEKPQTTTTSTTTEKPQTTTTTTTTEKPQTSENTANSQRTYRHLRKDAKRVTFEPGKRNCHELSVKRNGIYKFGSLDEIANDGNRFFYERYCDFFTDDRAWTVIQRRFADYNEESFNRSWTDYKNGFGSLDEEFWFGNDFIHKLTSDDDVELRILLEDSNGKTNWVEYSVFKMKSERDNYKLVISGYSSGSVGDSLLYHNDQEFSTYDHLNDNSQQTSCASSIGNGWWFKNCSDKDILGNFLGSTSTKMMIRPKK